MSGTIARPQKTATHATGPATTAAKVTRAVVNPPPISPAPARDLLAKFTDDAARKWVSARDLLRMCTDLHTEDINYSAESLTVLAGDALDAALESYDPLKIDAAYGEMSRAAAVIEYRMNDPRTECDEVCVLEGIHFLMESSMELVMEALKHRGDAA